MDYEKRPAVPDEERAQEFVYRQGDAVHVVRNSELPCANCRFAMPAAGACQKFERKPADILVRHAPCPEYVPVEGQEPVTISPSEEAVPVVTHTPQCVDCVHNLGLMDCAMFVRKPEEMLMNQRVCPAHQPEAQALFEP